MIQNLKLRIILCFLILFFAFITFLPNIADVTNVGFLPQQKVNYGLDIRGGLHLVMGVDIDGVIEEATNRLAPSLQDLLKTESVEVLGVESLVRREMRGNSRYQIRVNLPPGSDTQRVRTLVSDFYPSLQFVDADSATLNFRYTDFYLAELSTRTIEQAIETIRNRIDEFGVAEPSITAQGTDRILVQLPGIDDANRAKDLINKTARLDFMMLATEDFDLVSLIEEAEAEKQINLETMTYSAYIRDLNDFARDRLPPNTTIIFAKDDNVETMALGKIPYLVKTDTNLGGDSLRDAFISYDDFNNPIVSLSFNPTGATRFADLTGNNIGRQMAIVLDQVVYSAPVIQSRIPGGNAQITMGGGRDYQRNLEEAKTIAMALRAGALPARLEQLEERTIGPSLGADSIAAGKQAAYIAGLLVVTFMLLYYKGFGVLAVTVLTLNIFFILSLLTAIGATLTLPGIAGIVLTIGMAVDANVIIFERIKEELKKGASFKKSVEDGFSQAFSAIFDANVTTGITCVILIFFGTGPVRGFAVTLILGMICSMFTALFVSRTILDFLIVKMGFKKLSI